MPEAMEGCHNGRALPAELLTRVTWLVAEEGDLDQLDQIAEATTGLLIAVNNQRRAIRTARPPAPLAPAATPVEWLSAKEVAALLHRHESTIRHLPPDAIPGRRQLKKGGKVAWNKQIVLNWLAEGYR